MPVLAADLFKNTAIKLGKKVSKSDADKLMPKIQQAIADKLNGAKQKVALPEYIDKLKLSSKHGEIRFKASGESMDKLGDQDDVWMKGRMKKSGKIKVGKLHSEVDAIDSDD